MKNYFYFFLLSFVCITACVPPKSKSNAKGTIELSDPVVQEILKYTVDQKEDSLYVYLNHENPNYQYLALRAFSWSIIKAIRGEITTQTPGRQRAGN